MIYVIVWLQRLSQFWYDKETSDTLAREVLTVAVKSLTEYLNLFGAIRTYLLTPHHHLRFLSFLVLFIYIHKKNTQYAPHHTRHML